MEAARVTAGHRQAALLAHLFAIALDDLGVDEGHQLAAVLADVDHHHALVHIDLGRGQADAGRLVHRLGHVGDEPANRVIDHGHRQSLGVKAGIGVAEDGK